MPTGEWCVSRHDNALEPFLHFCPNRLQSKGLCVWRVVLQKAVVAYLNNLPVFKFKNDAKQTIISMAIESIEVHKDSLQVNISYMALTKTLIGYAVFVLFSLVIAVLMMRSGIVLPV